MYPTFDHKCYSNEEAELALKEISGYQIAQKAFKNKHDDMDIQAWLSGQRWLNGPAYAAIALFIGAVACGVWVSLPVAFGALVLVGVAAIGSVALAQRSLRSTLKEFLLTALPPYRNGELTELNDGELAELVHMTRLEPRVKERVAEWRNASHKLRRRDLLACRNYMQITEELRERSEILNRLAADEQRP